MRVMYCVVLAALMPVVASSSIVVVDPCGGGDCLTIQAGVDLAADGDTVLVAAGVYTGPGNCGTDLGTKNVVLRSLDGAAATVLQCESTGAAALRVSGGQDTTTSFTGFTISRADTGLCVVGSALAVSDCVLSLCWKESIHLEGGEAVLRRSRLKGDYSKRCRVHSLAGSTLSLVDCIVDTCEGMLSEDSSLVLRGCQVLHGWADDGGGAAICHGGTATFEDCLVQDCWTYQPMSCHGNALYIENGCVAQLDRVLFFQNGGANCQYTVYARGGSTVSLSEVTFWNNYEPYYGAALYMKDGTLDVANCTFAANQYCPAVGVGILCEAVITRTIMAYNSRAVNLESYGAVTTTNSCVFGNAAGDSLEGDHSDNLFSDPLFCDLEGADLTLHDDSPCLPAGNPWGVRMGAHEAGGCGLTSSVETPVSIILYPAVPNPSADRVEIAWYSPCAGAQVSVSVHDAAGRCVRTLETAAGAGGNNRVTWDCRDGGGRRVSSGVYFVQLHAGRTRLAGKLVVLR